MRTKKTGTDSLPLRATLAALMAQRELTLQQVADLAGVKKSVVQGWLSGSNPHDLRAVARLAKALGVGFKSLLLDEPEDVLPALDQTHDRVTVLDGLCEVTIRKIVPKGR